MSILNYPFLQDYGGESAEMKVAKVACINVTLWLVCWTPYAAVVIQVAIPSQWNSISTKVVLNSTQIQLGKLLVMWHVPLNWEGGLYTAFIPNITKDRSG